MMWHLRFLMMAVLLSALVYFLWGALTPYWPHPWPAARITLWLVVAISVIIASINFADRAND